MLHLFADSPFVLMNKATGFCIVKRLTRCLEVRWTTNDRLFVTTTKKCLGAQGKSVGSEVSSFDCDDKNDLQKWECRNETLLALKGQQLYIEVRADETIALSRNVGPNNHLTITGTSSGACSRTYRGTVGKISGLNGSSVSCGGSSSLHILFGYCASLLNEYSTFSAIDLFHTLPSDLYVRGNMSK